MVLVIILVMLRKIFFIFNTDVFFQIISDKKVAGKSKAEQMNERQQELERRLQDVTGQLGSGKKNAKKGRCRNLFNYRSDRTLYFLDLFLSQRIQVK
jgi:peptidoglycan hydrolase CwlO-like protein